MKLMVRSTGDDMEEDWAVDLAVSKLEEGGGGGEGREDEGWREDRGQEGGVGFGWRRVRGLNKRHVKIKKIKNQTEPKMEPNRIFW